MLEDGGNLEKSRGAVCCTAPPMTLHVRKRDRIGAGYVSF